MPLRLRLPLLAVIVASTLGGCGGASRSSFDGTTYREGPFAFRIPAVPSSWRPIDVRSAALAYRDDGSSASVLVNGRCFVKGDDAPLAALANHLLLGTTERRFLHEETFPFNGREAYHTRLVAKLDGVPMTYDVYVLKKDGCVYDLVRVAPPQGKGEGDEAPDATFTEFVHGFQALPSTPGSS